MMGHIASLPYLAAKSVEEEKEWKDIKCCIQKKQKQN